MAHHTIYMHESLYQNKYHHSRISNVKMEKNKIILCLKFVALVQLGKKTEFPKELINNLKRLIREKPYRLEGKWAPHNQEERFTVFKLDFIRINF